MTPIARGIIAGTIIGVSMFGLFKAIEARCHRSYSQGYLDGSLLPLGRVHIYSDAFDKAINYGMQHKRDAQAYSDSMWTARAENCSLYCELADLRRENVRLSLNAMYHHKPNTRYIFIP